MNFRPKTPLWVRWGGRGVVVFFLLLLFYLFLYTQWIPWVHPEIYAQGQSPPFYDLLALATGHGFLLFSHFIIEGSPLSNIFCSSNGDVIGAGEDVSESGDCFNRVEIIGTLIIFVLLLGIYFAIGALLGKWYEKKKS